MRERAKRVPVSRELRQEIKHQQGCKCGYCHQQYDEHDLYIHHKIPVSFHKKGEGEHANRVDNLVAVCSECHSFLDHKALHEKVYFDDLIEMQIGVEYPLP